MKTQFSMIALQSLLTPGLTPAVNVFESSLGYMLLVLDFAKTFQNSVLFDNNGF